MSIRPYEIHDLALRLTPIRYPLFPQFCIHSLYTVHYTLPMELLNPAGLWMLTAIAPLIILYILKVKRQRLRVPSAWLWAAAQRDLLAKSPFQRLTPQIPLLLQILAIILLALALARPATRSASVAGDHIALIIDTSASMSALDQSGKSRIEIAKSAAATIVDVIGPSTNVIVIEAGHDARAASPLERDRRRLKAAISLLDATHTEGDLGAAVALAVERLRPLGGSSRIFVFTDGALARPDSLASVDLPLEVVQVGSPVDNTAIIRVDVRSGSDPTMQTEQVQAFAMLANYGSRPRELFVTLRQHNASDVLASRKVLVQPGERSPVVLSFEMMPGDIGQGVMVELSPKDAMPVDDIAFGRIPPGAQIPVVIAAAGKHSQWLERAFRSDPHVELMSTSIANLTSGAVPPGALVVIEGACPSVLPPGDILIVNPPPGQCLTSIVKDEVAKPMITSWATADERFRFLTLDGVLLEKARLVEVDSPRKELIHTREGIIAADVSTPGRSATMISFDVGESNWPLKASFVLFVRNLVEQARSHRAHGVGGASVAGEPVRLAVPHNVDSVEIVGPGDVKQTARARDGLAIVPETTKTGIYHASWGGPSPGSVVFAVNLTSERESDVRDKPLALPTTGAAIATDVSQVNSHAEWSWLLAALGLAVVLADIAYVTRKPRSRGALLLAAPIRPQRPERSVA